MILDLEEVVMYVFSGKQRGNGTIFYVSSTSSFFRNVRGFHRKAGTSKQKKEEKIAC